MKRAVMAAPLFFLASSEPLAVNTAGGFGNLEVFRRFGVEDYFADAEPGLLGSVNVAAGPEGRRGIVVQLVPAGVDPLDGCGFYPDRQQWIQTRPDVWVGFTEPPRPQDLERPKCVTRSVETVLLDDGDLWECPVLRETVFNGVPVRNPEHHGSSLPAAVFQDVSGEWVTQILPRYRDLFLASRRWFDFWLNHGEIKVDEPAVMDFAVSVLNLRYRYTRDIHAAFASRILTTESMWLVTRVACGWAVVIRVIDKKKVIPM